MKRYCEVSLTLLFILSTVLLLLTLVILSIAHAETTVIGDSGWNSNGRTTTTSPNNLNVNITNGDTYFGGKVGIGTSSPYFPLHVEFSMPNTIVAYFKNTNTTGYGIQITPGNNTNYALGITDVAYTGNKIMLFGNGNGFFAGTVNAAGLKLDGGTRPVCDSTMRGLLWQTYGGTGVKDELAVCAKDATDAYAWRVLY